MSEDDIVTALRVHACLMRTDAAATAGVARVGRGAERDGIGGRGGGAEREIGRQTERQTESERDKRKAETMKKSQKKREGRDNARIVYSHLPTPNPTHPPDTQACQGGISRWGYDGTDT